MRGCLLKLFIIFIFFFITFFSIGIFMEWVIAPTLIYIREGVLFSFINIEDIDFILHIKRSAIVSGLVSTYIILIWRDRKI